MANDESLFGKFKRKLGLLFSKKKVKPLTPAWSTTSTMEYLFMPREELILVAKKPNHNRDASILMHADASVDQGLSLDDCTLNICQ